VAESSLPAQPLPSLKLVVRSLFGLLAGVVVAVVAAWYSKIDAKEAARLLSHVPLPAVLGCALSAFVVLALQALRWHRVMKPLLGLRYRDAYKAQIVGVLFNALLPARGGDLLRVQYLGRRTGKSRATILGTEIVDRWLDFWGWIPTFLFFVVADHPPAWLFKALGIFGAILIGFGGGMLLLTHGGWKPDPSGRLGSFLHSLRMGVQAFRERHIWTTALLLAPLPWLWEALVLKLAGHSFGLDLSMMQAFSVLIGFNIAMVVPSPGGIGSVEGGGVLALVFFGFDQEKALVFITVYHLCQLLPGMGGGAAVLISDGEKLFGRQAASEGPEEGALPSGGAGVSPERPTGQ
jgi:glycosyltransferase 2 family protein